MVCFPVQTGGVGIAKMFEKIEHRQCMGFDEIVHRVWLLCFWRVKHIDGKNKNIFNSENGNRNIKIKIDL